MISDKTRQYLVERFSSLSTRAVELKGKIDTAKTQLKKDFYLKKLKKVNTQALDILLLINRSNELAKEENNDGKEIIEDNEAPSV